jgi:hypothetical protein
MTPELWNDARITERSDFFNDNPTPAPDEKEGHGRDLPDTNTWPDPGTHTLFNWIAELKKILDDTAKLAIVAWSPPNGNDVPTLEGRAFAIRQGAMFLELRDDFVMIERAIIRLSDAILGW